MNTDHRSIRPLPADLQQNLAKPLLPAACAAPARMPGVEVADSSFDAWLAAGGERRRRPRADPTSP